jgi:hypothetical protein
MFLHRPQRVSALCKIHLIVISLRQVLDSPVTTKKEKQQEADQSIFIPDILAYVCLGQCCFFSLGNSHTLGTADFAGAYTGATEFGKTTIGFIAWSMVFTGPLASYAGALPQLLRHDDVGAWMMMVTVAVFRLVVLTVSSVVTFHFQHHLFVWSVFAPKFVYEVGQTFVVVLFVLLFCMYCACGAARTESREVEKIV